MKGTSNGFEQEQHYYRFLRLVEYYESQFILQTLRARQDTLSLDMAETPVNVVKARHACEYYCNLYEYNL